MNQDRFRGVFTISSTPFDKNGNIDWGDLKRIIDFCVARECQRISRIDR